MKIIYLIAGTYRAAGMERVLAGKTAWLASHGCEILVATTDQRGRKPAFGFAPQVRHIDLGINYEETNGGSFVSKIVSYPFKQIRHFFALKRLLACEKPDIVVSMFCNDAGLLPHIPDGRGKVLEIHFSRLKRLQYGRTGLWAVSDRLRSRHDSRVVARYDKFVVLTEEDRRLWGELDNICVIPNSKPFEIEGPVEYDRASRTVLAAGRLNFQKAFDRLVEAWARLPQSLLSEGWKLEIAGEGEEKDKIEALIHELGLEGSVILSGACPDMRRKYLKSSIYAMTSRYEGLPMVLVEAQTCGLPIVAMACQCGPRDVVSDGEDGFLVPDGDVDAFARKLAALMSDEDLRAAMSQAAVRASGRYDEEIIMPRWKELFENLCAR